MDAIDIRTELQKLIEQEKDINILEAIRTLLNKTRLDNVLKAKLIQRSEKSEKDIVNGRLLSREDVIRRMDSSLGK